MKKNSLLLCVLLVAATNPAQAMRRALQRAPQIARQLSPRVLGSRSFTSLINTGMTRSCAASTMFRHADQQPFLRSMMATDAKQKNVQLGQPVFGSDEAERNYNEKGMHFCIDRCLRQLMAETSDAEVMRLHMIFNERGCASLLRAAASVGNMAVLWNVLSLVEEYGGTKLVMHVINEPNEHGETALLLAVKNEHWDIAEALLYPDEYGLPSYLGLDVNIPDKNGWMALHCAAKRGDYELVHSLLIRGAEANAQTKDGDTPLHVVAKYCSTALDVIAWLLRAEADVSIKNNDGKTAVDLAFEYGHYGIIKELIERGVNIPCRALVP